jgi:hypothetical protein
MAIKFFSFSPDNHYAYPEINSIEENINDLYVADEEEVLSAYVEAPYSVIDYDFDETDKPKEEDFNSEDEYDAAYDEWYEEMQKDVKEGYFHEWGNYDVYQRIFLVMYTDGLEIDIPEWVQDFIEWNMGNGTAIVMDLIKELGEVPGIKFVFSTISDAKSVRVDSGTIIYSDGKFIQVEQDVKLDYLSNLEDEKENFLVNFLGNIIIKYVNDEKISQAGKFMASLLSIEGLEDYIKSEITPDEYYSLEKSYKSHSILNRFR